MLAKKLFLGALLAGVGRAHYRFNHLLVNYTNSGVWQYVRDISAGPWEGHAVTPTWPKSIPLLPPDIFHLDIRCGRDAWMKKPNGTDRLTETADVVAGTEVGFRIGYNIDGLEPWIFHEGPAQAYLAKAPEDMPLSEWEGDGDYFKIAHYGAINSTDWGLYRKNGPPFKDWNFTIPATTPPGKYLLRMEHIFPHEKNETQFYISCAQVNIMGPGGGKPTEFARFPGTYQLDDPGVNIPEGTEEEVYADFLKYGPAPGPPVWTG